MNLPLFEVHRLLLHEGLVLGHFILTTKEFDEQPA